MKNLQELRDKLKAFPKYITEEISVEFVASAQTIVRNAQVASPIKDGNLRQSISYFQRSTLNVQVIAAAHYAAYQEFGTGALVDVPPGFENLAARARGQGIRQVNINPHPYFIPAVQQEAPQLVARISNIINDEIQSMQG